MRMHRFCAAAVCVAALFTSVAHADPAPWSRSEKRWLAAAQLALLADMGQTLDISHSCHNGGGYYELNPVLGRCPDRAAVVGYFALAGVGTWWLADRLPSPWRMRFLAAATLVEVGVVGHNARIGLKLRF